MADAPDSEIVVYKRPGCGYCITLAVGLRRRGVHYRSVDISKDDDAAAFVRRHAAGNETVPTVVIGGRVLVNPSARQVVAHLEAARGGSTPSIEP
ncbi:MAG: glutathione S-transferase N-terminal domain-containing protein [Actinomycetota bacterium]|nr:glutathione S-transferase N-terminal domain-containing protein [Actinomycetota bacterium]